MSAAVDRGPLAGRCRECLRHVATISDVCEAHEIDDKARALRLLARDFAGLVVLDTPGRLVVALERIGGYPWVDIALLPSQPSFRHTFDLPDPGFVYCQRVRLDGYEVRWRRFSLWVYSHDWSYDHRLQTMLDAWTARPGHPGKTPAGKR